ncbi:hypothetical protein Salat_0218400 [Sesamum alatum]|uniref:Uncharacterized protein n=1 Tax=Sesamum alatum TaxID=300844 RepID=A0AAE1YZU7_9LAMI|nr:hypothetical protein Salat_0218400 [Sesamum alatum]
MVMNARIAEIARNLGRRNSPAAATTPLSNVEISDAHVGDQPSGSFERQALAPVEVASGDAHITPGDTHTSNPSTVIPIGALVAIEIASVAPRAREDLKTPIRKVAEMKGEKLNPDWAISARSSVLRTHVGQDSFELYKACCLERDQVLLAQTAYTRAKEKEALKAKATTDARIAALEAQLAATVEESKKKVAAALDSGRSEGFSAGLLAGKTEGITEGHEAFLQSDEYHKSLSDARLQGARDFLKAPAFKMAVDLQFARFLNDGFDKCISQVRHLQGFVKGFDEGRLDSTLDATRQPYPDEPISEVAGEDEFTSLIADIGAFP